MEIGKGMKNVQLLVVDSASLEQGRPRLCGVGEQGEIFFRAGGKFHVNYRNSTDLWAAKNFQVSLRAIWAPTI